MGEDEKVYLRPQDWWPETIPEGHVLLLLKAVWHETGSTTMAYAHLRMDGTA
jgi:hypothetical protein